MKTNTLTEFSLLRAKAGLSVSEAATILQVTERSVKRYEDAGPKGIEPHKLVLDALSRAAEINVNKRQRPEADFKFIDLFSGIGGMRIPFEELGGDCVFSSEWDKFSRETYIENYTSCAEHLFAGDIREFSCSPAQIPKHDLLVAGFPCQPFSLAGVSKKNSLGRPHGFLCDTQGTLFYDVAEIIKFHRPKVFLLENVKNLEGHDKGKTFATIMNVLENELKYNVTYKVIDSSPWVPQKRQRIFIVGVREGSEFDFDTIAVPKDQKPKLGDILDEKVDEKYTLTPKLWEYLQAYKAKHQKAGNGFGFSLFGPNDVARTLSARYHKDGSEILIEQKGKRPRRLTPRECSRLMGFEKKGTNRPFSIVVSDTQAYRQFGNAVVVPVVRAIAQSLLPHILEDQLPYSSKTDQLLRTDNKNSYETMDTALVV